jgi:hypothetical protein
MASLLANVTKSARLLRIRGFTVLGWRAERRKETLPSGRLACDWGMLSISDRDGAIAF